MDDERFRFYVSGKMTGLKDHGFRSFQDAKKKLEAQGIIALLPSENFGGAVVDALRAAYMRRDILQVLNADAVVVLPGWQNSEGAKAEIVVAREIGIPVLNIEDLSEITERVVTSVEPLMSLREDIA